MSNYKPYQPPQAGGQGPGKAPGQGPDIPVWLPLVLLFVSPPLGIAVFVLRAMIQGKFPLQRGGQAQQPTQQSEEPAAQKAPAQSAQPQQEVSKTSDPYRYGSAEPKHTAAPRAQSTSAKKAASGRSSAGAAPLIMVIIGLCLVLYGFNMTIDPIRMVGYGLFSLRVDLWPLISGIVSILGGCGMLGMAVHTRRLRHLRRNLKNAVGKRDNITLAEICRVLSCNEKSARTAAEAAVNAGELGPTAFFDHSSDVLVIRGEAPRPEPAKPVQPEAPQSQYEAILQQLRLANDAIPGEEMSEKISRLEDISAKIFDLAEKDPSKVPQLRKFLNYYLPTSLKLLKTYAELDAQGIDGSNITQSKREIEATMDTLCNAFAAQLDKLFSSDAMDVSADIAAMQAMLAQDGLTADSDFSLPG